MQLKKQSVVNCVHVKLFQQKRKLLKLQTSLGSEFGEMSIVHADENKNATVSKLLLVWTEEQTYWFAAGFLMLGFELELYSPCEYGMLYWCSKELIRDISQFAPTILFLQCYVCLLEGLAMMLAALSNRKVLQKPSIFNMEEERFNQHFELLQKARVPDYISYDLFKQLTMRADFDSLVRCNNFSDVLRIWKELRSSLSSGNDPDKLVELLKIEQVTERNRIALNVLHQAGTHDPSLNVLFELAHHPCIAIAVVRRS